MKKLLNLKNSEYSDKLVNWDYVSGFTLLALMLVLGISLILTTSLFFYTGSTKSQLLIFQDQSKIIGALQKAKAMSMNIYEQNPAPCGYGVHFEIPNKILIFKDLPSQGTSNCSNADYAFDSGSGGPNNPSCPDYSSSPECIEEINLDLSTKISNISTLVTASNIVTSNQTLDIDFVPPDPATFIDAGTVSSGTVQILNGSFQKTIGINGIGRISSD